MPEMSRYPDESADDFMRRMMGKNGRPGSMVKAASRFMRTKTQKEGKKEAEKY